MVVLVKNQEGYRNLSELITLSFTEGFYRKPRIDKEILEKYRNGLVALSACVQGEIPYNLLKGREDKAYKAAKWYQELFKDDYYIELQNHSLADQIKVLPKLIKLSQDLSIPVVATNDVRFISPEQFDAHEIRVAIHDGYTMVDPNRPKLYSNQQYLRTAEEMQALFETTWVLPVSSPSIFDFKFEIVGDKGAMHVDVQDQMVHQSADRFTYPGTLVVEIHGQTRGFPLYMLDSFIESVKNGTEPLATIEEGHQVTRIVDAAHRSIVSGQPVAL